MTHPTQQPGLDDQVVDVLRGLLAKLGRRTTAGRSARKTLRKIDELADAVCALRDAFEQP